MHKSYMVSLMYFLKWNSPAQSPVRLTLCNQCPLFWLRSRVLCVEMYVNRIMEYVFSCGIWLSTSFFPWGIHCWGNLSAGWKRISRHSIAEGSEFIRNKEQTRQCGHGRCSGLASWQARESRRFSWVNSQFCEFIGSRQRKFLLEGWY